jgi:hypothetical protein
MCFGKSSSSNRQAPAPTPAPAQGSTVPDISAQQKLAAVTQSSSATPPFGSELGTGAAPNAMPGAQ